MTYPIPEGFTPWEHKHPPPVLIVILRPGVEQIVRYPSELHPWTNICGLYWALTGIGRIELEGTV